MRSLFALFLSFCLTFSGLFSSISIAVAETRTLIATAYYSPLPGQSRYLRGSYEADIRLNGNGTHGASGVPVSAGMIAAPKSYSFGTQIYIPGMGTGIVQDRGGAIVAASKWGHAYDRIDIWMGSGEEGLKRALTWGKRTVVAEVTEGKLSPKSNQKFVLPKSPTIELAAMIPESKVSRAKTQSGSVIVSQQDAVSFREVITAKSDPKAIRKLSEVLARLGYLDPTSISSVFWPDLKMAIIRFQLEKKLITTISEPAAGVLGPKTRSLLMSAYGEWQKDDVAIRAEIDSLHSSLDTRLSSLHKEIDSARDTLAWVDSLKLGESGVHVRNIQEMLAKLGYFEGKTTWIFAEKTKDALARFQIAEKLVSGKNDPNAGKFWIKTKNRLVALVATNR